MLAMPRFLRCLRGVRCVTRRCMTSAGRMHCDGNGKNADKAGARARPSARTQMICCQLSLPNPAIVAGIFTQCTLPNVNFR